LPRKKEFSKKLTTKNATQKEQNTSSSNLRETAYQSSDCDTRRANGVLGSRSCVVNKCALSADFLPPFLPSKFAVEVRSLASSQSTFCAVESRPLSSSQATFVRCRAVKFAVSTRHMDQVSVFWGFFFFLISPPLIFATWRQKKSGAPHTKECCEKNAPKSPYIFREFVFPKIVIYRHLGSSSSPKYSKTFILFFLLSFLP